MDWERLGKLKIPIRQEGRNQVLKDALATRNPLLIEFALSLDAEIAVGGEELLEYAILQGDLQLAQKLIPSIEGGAFKAMNMAIDNDNLQIATWLANQGTYIKINQLRLKEHLQTIMHLLTVNPNAKTEITYGALLETIFHKEGEKVLTMLLESMQKNTPGALRAWLIKLADDTVDTDRVDCMEVMVKFGLDVAYVNTKYCHTEKMRKFLKENGGRVD